MAFMIRCIITFPISDQCLFTIYSIIEFLHNAVATLLNLLHNAVTTLLNLLHNGYSHFYCFLQAAATELNWTLDY